MSTTNSCEVDSLGWDDYKPDVTSASPSANYLPSGCRSGKMGEGPTIKVDSGDASFEMIRQKFHVGFGKKAVIVSIHRRNWSENSISEARRMVFQIHARGLGKKYDGEHNVKFGWYGCSKERIQEIFGRGFSVLDLDKSNGAVVLSSDDFFAQSVEDTVPDEEGFRRVLLCRVLLGRYELIHPGSGQSDRNQFDSGVDSIDNPKKYVIWSTVMNTHILPEFVVTFRLNAAAQSYTKGCRSGKMGEGPTIKLDSGDTSFEMIRQRFFTGFGDKVVIKSVHRRNWSENSISLARRMVFHIHANGLEIKYAGDHNVKFGWYGSSKESIEEIFAGGFSVRDMDKDNGAVVLSSDDFFAQSVKDSGPDEEGFRRVLLCRVLLGRSEVIQPGSVCHQSDPNQFVSGVDSIENPKKYIIWSTIMNTHILPEFVVTFFIVNSAAQSSPRGITCVNNAIRVPSTQVSLQALLKGLVKYLDSNAMSLLFKLCKDYKEKRISQSELKVKMSRITGDELLKKAIITTLSEAKSRNQGT